MTSSHVVNLWLMTQYNQSMTDCCFAFTIFKNHFYCFLEIFYKEDVRWKLFWNFQGWFMIQFSKFIFVAAVIFLFLSDSLYSLSHQKTFVNNFFKLFFIISSTVLFLSDSLDIITLLPNLVNRFFYFFQKTFFRFRNKKSILETRTEKEGFEPSRRVNDLHP